MIDLRKSAELNGMAPIELYSWLKKYPRSCKMVISVCDNCGKERKVSYHDIHDLCRSCSHKKTMEDPLEPEPQLCECGCGNYANPGNRFIHGHNNCKTPWKPKPELEPQLCECGCGNYAEPGNKFIKGHNRRNIKHSDKTIKKMITSQNKYWEDPLKREMVRERSIKQFKDPIAREKHSAIQQGIPYDEWEDFAREQLYCPDFNEECKESNREKYDRLCFLTGLPEEDNITSTGKQQHLSVHHVDMDKGQGCDGIKWKLVPLCMSWHGKVHNELWEARIIWLLDNVWN